MLTNSQMKAGRFAKLAKGRRLMRLMNECWDTKGGFVRVGTYLKYMDLRASHRDLVSMTRSGSVMLQRGKRSECLDFCSFQFAKGV